MKLIGSEPAGLWSSVAALFRLISSWVCVYQFHLELCRASPRMAYVRSSSVLLPVCTRIVEMQDVLFDLGQFG